MRWCLILLVLLGVRGTAGDWPQWLGPGRDGISTEKVEPWKTAPKELWRVAVGPGYSVPVVAEGRTFVHARVAGKEEEEVLALDAKTGKQLWRASYKRAPFSSIINTGPQGTPSVVKGRVYTYGITGVLSCYEAASGKQVWQVDAVKKLEARVPRFGCTCSPLVVGDRVLVAVGGKGSAVAAFDAGSGELAWKALDGPISTGSPVVYLNRAKKDMASLEAVFVNGRSLVALNPFDGEVSWEFPLSDAALGTAPSPVVAGDLLVASSIKAGAVAVQLTHKDERTTASGAWQNAELTGYFCTPVVCGKDHVYMITSTLLPQPTSTLRCIEVKTGKEAWQRSGVGVFSAGLVRVADDRVLVLDDKGVLRLLEHDPKGYRELATAQACGASFVTPALADGCLYVRDARGVACLLLGG